MAKASKNGAKNFLLQDLNTKILFAMAGDRYAGWIGQIYSGGNMKMDIRRSHKVGDKTFNGEPRLRA